MTDFSWTHPAYEPIARLVAGRTGLLFREMQRDSVEIGIQRGMKEARVASLENYLQYLERHVAAFDDLVAELTVGETYFFRDLGQFDIIRREVIPDVRSRRGWNHVLRTWSAACASGEEVYSLAMLFHAEGLGSQWHVLGTDVSRRALKRAREATYGEWSLRGEGVELARPHLKQQGKQYEVAPHLRSQVAFEYLNLALDLYPSTVTGTRDLDLILCRNVLIYFDRETICAVARRLCESLSLDGWLITAACDPSLEEFAPWDAELTRAGLVYRRRPRPVGASWTESRTTAAAVSANVGSDFFCTDTPVAELKPTLEFEAESARQEPRLSDQFVAVSVAPVVSLADAESALLVGDYARAAELAAQCDNKPEAQAIRVQALANVDPVAAEVACAVALKTHGLSEQLHYLHAVLLLELDREQEAVSAAQRAIYLQPNLAIAHFLLGSTLRRLDDRKGACRAFRAVCDLCFGRPTEEVVLFSDGEHAGSLARAAEQQLRSLEL